jgi:hypothetical protein
MTFNPKGLFVTAAFVIALLIALQSDAIHLLDSWYGYLEVILVAALSIATIVSMIRHRRFHAPPWVR